MLETHFKMYTNGLMLILIGWFLHLPMSKKVLEIFNCSPIIPPDGYTYMSAVFERCWEPGGVHMSQSASMARTAASAEGAICCRRGA